MSVWHDGDSVSGADLCPALGTITRIFQFLQNFRFGGGAGGMTIFSNQEHGIPTVA